MKKYEGMITLIAIVIIIVLFLVTKENRDSITGDYQDQ